MCQRPNTMGVSMPGMYVWFRSLMTTDVAADHIHLMVTNLASARRLYGQRFGNVIPGIRLEFIQLENPIVPTKGPAVDPWGTRIELTDWPQLSYEMHP